MCKQRKHPIHASTLYMKKKDDPGAVLRKPHDEEDTP